MCPTNTATLLLCPHSVCALNQIYINIIIIKGDFKTCYCKCTITFMCQLGNNDFWVLPYFLEKNSNGSKTEKKR